MLLDKYVIMRAIRNHKVKKKLLMKEVTIYTTPTCHFCKEAKAFFKENKIEYKEHDVLSDLGKRKEMVEKSGQMGVPVITIGNELVIGFDRDRIADLLRV